MQIEIPARDTHAGALQLTDEDLELIRRCQEKDPVAFERLMRKFKPVTKGVLKQFDFRVSDCDDLQQEVNIRVWSNISGLREPRLFASWLRRICKNICYDHMRKNTIKVSSLDEKISEDGSEDFLGQIADETNMPCVALQMIELESVLSSAVESLPRQFREALLMRELSGLSYEQIAQRENCEVGTIKSRISRARNRVRSLVSPYLDQCA